VKDSTRLVGYIDVTGQFVLPPQFEMADPFSEGLAFVRRDGGSILINKAGEFVADAQYADHKDFAEGLAAVKTIENELWGYIDRTGQFVIPPQFAKAESFQNGYAIVSLAEGGETYVDSQGQIVVTPGNYLKMTNFNSGVAVLSKKVNLDDNPFYGVVNASGEMVVPFEFFMIDEYSEGLAVAGMGHNQPMGYLDPGGNFAIEPQFSFAGSFSEGRAFVKTYESCGYIDPTGQQVVGYLYTSCASFSEGIAWVQEQDEGPWIAINLEGTPLFELAAENVFAFKEGLARFMVGTQMGVVNPAGEVVIPLQDYLFQDFQDGLAKFERISAEGYAEGYIDRSGKIVYEFKR
jgi:hypothetical protein